MLVDSAVFLLAIVDLILFEFEIIKFNLFEFLKTNNTDRRKNKNTVNEIKYVIKSIDFSKGNIAKGLKKPLQSKGVLYDSPNG